MGPFFLKMVTQEWLMRRYCNSNYDLSGSLRRTFAVKFSPIIVGGDVLDAPKTMNKDFLWMPINKGFSPILQTKNVRNAGRRGSEAA